MPGGDATMKAFLVGSDLELNPNWDGEGQCQGKGFPQLR